jgi:hypothetical protein
MPDIIPDDWTVDTRKYSWLNNGNFLSEDRPLLKILLNDKDLNLASVDRIGRIQYNTGAMLNIMQSISDVNKKLSVFGFATPGQPVRASEFMDMKIKNSTRPRGYFRNNKESWFVTRRVKSENLVRRESFFPIKLNPSLAELLDFYLLVIRPVEAEFAWILWGEEAHHVYDEYLWVHLGGYVTDEQQFSNTLQKTTNRLCGVGLSIRPYRQLIIAVARVYLGSEAEIDEDDEDDLLARQSNHSPEIRARIYAPEEGHLPCMSSDVLLRYGRVSEAWWRLTGFKPGAAPLLPLKVRRNLVQDLPGSTTDNAITTTMPGPGIDITKLLEHISATVSSSVSQLKIDLAAEIQQKVALGLAEVFQRHPGLNQAHIRPPHGTSSSSLLPLPPAQTNNNQPWNSHNLEDLYHDSNMDMDFQPSNMSQPSSPSPKILVPSTSQVCQSYLYNLSTAHHSSHLRQPHQHR